MSSSGGFYKYRCKYFLTHNCPNWVFVNHAPCADCCAAGRDMDDDLPDDLDDDALAGRPFDLGVPVFEDGVLHYAVASLAVSIAPGAAFVSWAYPARHAAPAAAAPAHGAAAAAALPHHAEALPPSFAYASAQAPSHDPYQPHAHDLAARQHDQPQQLLQLQLQLQQHPLAHAPHLPPHPHALQHGHPPQPQQHHRPVQAPHQRAKMQLPPHSVSTPFPAAAGSGGIGDIGGGAGLSLMP